jgi:hypothetical protein
MVKFEYPGPTSLADRVAGALIAFVFVGVTIILVPIAIGWYVRPRWVYHASGLYSKAFFVWLIALSVAAAVWGARLGSLRTVEMLGHLWGTGMPKDSRLTEKLWAMTLITACVTFAFVFPWRKLF